MTDSASQSLVDRGWTPEQFWEYLEAFVGDWETKTIRTMMADHGLSLAPAARIAELEAERDELRVAIFGNDGYDPILRNGNFVEMATATELGRLGAIDRALAAEFELTRVEVETVERASRCIPTSWLDPLLTGDDVKRPPLGAREIEALLRGIQDRVRSLPPLAKRGEQKSCERSNPPAEQSPTLPQQLTEN